jgi:chromosomal replication initiator protein
MMDLCLAGYSLGLGAPHKSTKVAFKRRPLVIRRIQREVAEYYDIAEIEMVSNRRSREVAQPRQVAMFLARELTTKSLPEIGRYFGDRDHTTVMHSLNVVAERMAINDDVRDDVAILRERLSNIVASVWLA